jgi:hypothetical protein
MPQKPNTAARIAMTKNTHAYQSISNLLRIDIAFAAYPFMSRPEAIPLGQETPRAFLYSLNALVPDVKVEIATSNSNLLQAVVRRRMRFPLGGHG